MSQAAKFLSLTSCNCGSCSEEGTEMYDEKTDEMTSNVDAFEYANRSTPQTRRVLKQMLAAEHSRAALLLWICREGLCWLACQSLPNFTCYVQEHSWGKRQGLDRTWQVPPQGLFDLTDIYPFPQTRSACWRSSARLTSASRFSPSQLSQWPVLLK